MFEPIFTRIVASRRTLDPDKVRFGPRHVAFAAAILALSLWARAETPFDTLGATLKSPAKGPIGHEAVFDTHGRAMTPEGAVSGDEAMRVFEVPRTPLLFSLSVRGSLLRLDWKDDAEVQAIRIYDLQGRLLFAWTPASGSAPTSGDGSLGRWVWDGRDSKGSRLERGRYLIRVQTLGGTRNQVFVWGRDG